MIRFHSFSKRPKHFLSFTGLTVDEFLKLERSIKVDWREERNKKLKANRIRKIGGGRKLALQELKDRLLVFLVYAKVYPSYLLLEYLFNVDESNI